MWGMDVVYLLKQTTKNKDMKYKIGNEPAKHLEVGKLYSDLPENAAHINEASILRLADEDGLKFEYVDGYDRYVEYDGLCHFGVHHYWYLAEPIEECE